MKGHLSRSDTSHFCLSLLSQEHTSDPLLMLQVLQGLMLLPHLLPHLQDKVSGINCNGSEDRVVSLHVSKEMYVASKKADYSLLH